LVFVLSLVTSIWAQNGQLDITMKALTHSPIDEHSVVDLTKLKFRKFNRTTQMLKGEFEILVDFDNNITVRLAIQISRKLLNILSTFRSPPLRTKSKVTSGE
jgi:hypothetical protein